MKHTAGAQYTAPALYFSDAKTIIDIENEKLYNTNTKTTNDTTNGERTKKGDAAWKH